MVKKILFVALLCLLPAVVMAFDYSGNDTGGRAATSTRVIASSHVAVPLTGTLTETTLWSMTIPGGMLGPNGTIKAYFLVSFPSSANVKTIKVKLGSTVFHTIVPTTYKSWVIVKTISNRNSVSSQISNSAWDNIDYGPSANNIVTTASINTAADQTLSITGQLANTGETITLENVIVELVPGIN